MTVSPTAQAGHGHDGEFYMKTAGGNPQPLLLLPPPAAPSAHFCLAFLSRRFFQGVERVSVGEGGSAGSQQGPARRQLRDARLHAARTSLHGAGICKDVCKDVCRDSKKRAAAPLVRTAQSHIPAR